MSDTARLREDADRRATELARQVMELARNYNHLRTRATELLDAHNRDASELDLKIARRMLADELKRGTA